jgi:hypothetical protein
MAAPEVRPHIPIVVLVGGVYLEPKFARTPKPGDRVLLSVELFNEMIATFNRAQALLGGLPAPDGKPYGLTPVSTIRAAVKTQCEQ